MSAHNRKAGIVQTFAVVLTSDLIDGLFDDPTKNADTQMESAFLNALAAANPPIVEVGRGRARRERRQRAVIFFAAEDEKAVCEILKRLEIPTVRA